MMPELVNQLQEPGIITPQFGLVQLDEGQSLDRKLYERMLLIRRFEERILDEFSKGQLFGTTHTCIGQEADAVGIFSVVDSNDIVFSNHRCHGHFISYGGDMRRLAAELMGKASGLCGGRGGSQHICWRDFYSSGVQGGIVPCAAGMALAEKAKGSGQIVLTFLGDGTLGQGVVYESLNLASLWKLPLLFVLENNRYAQTTPIHLALAGSISARFEAFGIECTELESTDVLEVRHHAAEAIDRVRQEARPGALVIHTYRLCAHSKRDDTRDPEEVEKFSCLDPLLVHGRRLSEAERNSAESACEELIDQAFAAAYDDPFPTPADLSSPLEALP
jgi:TPP-dependent pyruvate/acetoin dehydrogenase alpha subunit